MNLNLAAVNGSLLVISQFTLYADLKSRRPGFSHAAKPDLAIPCTSSSWRNARPGASTWSTARSAPYAGGLGQRRAGDPALRHRHPVTPFAGGGTPRSHYDGHQHTQEDCKLCFVYAMTVGPVATNCYLLGDERTRTGAIIDPGANGKEIAEIAKQSGTSLTRCS